MNTSFPPAEFDENTDRPVSIGEATEQLLGGGTLSYELTCQVFESMMMGRVHHAEIGALLGILATRVPTGDEIAGAATIMRKHVRKVETSVDRTSLLDTAATGGPPKTFNVSTAAAIVAAAGGANVAKHGNKAVSSKSGAADVLSSLGIKVDCEMDLVGMALKEAGICFLMAPRHHSAMRHVGPVRAELGIRTIFNMLGPLANPALVKRIMVGVFDPALCVPFAHALASLGTTHAWVVHGADGLDEVSTTGETKVAALVDGAVSEFTISPDDIGLPTVPIDALHGGTPEENAASLRALLDGAAGPYRDVVVLNAAAALVGGGHAGGLQDAAARAVASIDDGNARAALDRLVAITNSGEGS